MKFELATRTVDCGLAHSSVRIPYKIMGNEAHNVASKVERRVAEISGEIYGGQQIERIGIMFISRQQKS